jgi:DNA-binding NarL/FixJ family response regulator
MPLAVYPPPTRKPKRPMSTIRILIAEDQPMLRRGLAMLVDAEGDLQVVGQAANGAEAVELALRLRPDVVLMDLQMPVLNGVEATRQITERLAGIKVVVLTTFDDDELVYSAISAGASAYLLKDAPESDIFETVRGVGKGEARLSPAIADKVIRAFRRQLSTGDRTLGPPTTGSAEPSHVPVRRPPSEPHPLPLAPIGYRAESADSPSEALSPKESQVLQLIAAGLANKQIAMRMGLAEGTVKNHVSRIMDKLHASNRTELALRAGRTQKADDPN